MADKKHPVGSGIVHATRPSIQHLIGKDVIVTHHDAKTHGTWDGKLEFSYANGAEKTENFAFKVEGTPCPYCKKRCTDPGVKVHGCKTWNGIPEDERYEHSSQPTLFFKPHAVFSVAGNVIILG